MRTRHHIARNENGVQGCIRTNERTNEETNKRLTRRFAAAIVVIAVTFGFANIDPPSNAAAIGVVLPRPAEASPANRVDELIGELDSLAEGMRSDFGFVWFDAAAGQVVVDVATVNAERAAGALVRREQGLVRTRVVRSSRQALVETANRLIEQAGVVEAYVDNEANAVVAVVENANVTLDTAMARGGVEVRQRFDPSVERGRPALGRMSDNSPYYGGARTVNPDGSGCSSGLPWKIGTTSLMLTAGHCVPNGGTTKSASGAIMGSTAGGTRENWAPGFGTAWIPGDNQYRGDLALIAISGSQTVAGRLYRGGISSTTSSAIAGRWYRSPQVGDQFCSGGTRSGELCGWVVQATNVVHEYSTGEVLRSGFEATRAGSCIIAGDSGGPAFTVQSDGRLAAKGIISGSNSSSSSCRAWFTDVWHAVYLWSGNVATG